MKTIKYFISIFALCMYLLASAQSDGIGLKFVSLREFSGINTNQHTYISILGRTVSYSTFGSSALVYSATDTKLAGNSSIFYADPAGYKIQIGTSTTQNANFTIFRTDPRMRIIKGSAGVAEIEFGTSTTNDAVLSLDASETFSIGTKTSKSLNFITGNTIRGRFSNTGKFYIKNISGVGIGLLGFANDTTITNIQLGPSLSLVGGQLNAIASTNSNGIYSNSDTLPSGGTKIHSTLGRTGLTIDQDISSASASSTTRSFRIISDEAINTKTHQYLTLKSPKDSVYFTGTDGVSKLIASNTFHIDAKDLHLTNQLGTYDLNVRDAGLLGSSAFEDTEFRYASGSNTSRIQVDNANVVDMRTTDGDGIAQIKTTANSSELTFVDASTSTRKVIADSTAIAIVTPTLNGAAIKIGQVPVTVDAEGHIKYSNALTTLDTVFTSTGTDFSSTVFANAFASGYNVVNLSAILNSGSSSSLQVLFPSASAVNLGKRIHLKTTDNSGTHDIQISFTTGQLILQGETVSGTLLTMGVNDYIELVSVFDGTNYYWQSQGVTKSYRPHLDDKCYVQGNVSLTVGIAPTAWRIPNYLVGKTIKRVSYSFIEAGGGTGDTSVRINIGGTLASGVLSGASQYGLTAISPGNTFSELALSGVPALVAGQLITVEVTGVSTTAPKGLSVSIEFQ